MVIIVFDLDGNKIDIVNSDMIESNVDDDLDDTIDLEEVVKKINEE